MVNCTCQNLCLFEKNIVIVTHNSLMCVSVHMSDCSSVSVCMSVCLSVCISFACLGAYICLYVRTNVHLGVLVCLAVCLFI